MANVLLAFRNRPPKFLQHPHPKLKRVAEEVDFKKVSKEDLVKIVRKLGAALSTATYGDKLGIAAPQVGINKRIIVVKGVVMVNPTWRPSKAPPTQMFEGCYSVMGRVFETERVPYGWATWYSIDGILREYKLNGVEAVVFQHELDHLNGICCADIGKELLVKK